MPLSLIDVVSRGDFSVALASGYRVSVVGIAGADFDTPGTDCAWLIDLEQKAIIGSGIRALTLLAMQEKAKSVGENAAEYARREADRQKGKAIEEYGERIGEIIGNGRLQLTFLLNSGGGFGTLMNKFLDAAKTVHACGGATACFTATHAESAAGMLLFAGPSQRRHVLPDTLVMLHAAHHGDPSQPPSNEQHAEDVERDTQKIAELLRREVAVSHRRTIEEMLVNARSQKKNYYNEIVFTGADLATWNAASAARDVRELAASFVRETGLPTDIMDHGNPVSDFFFLAELEYRCRQQGAPRVQFRSVQGLPSDLDIVSHPPIDPEPTDKTMETVAGVTETYMQETRLR